MRTSFDQSHLIDESDRYSLEKAIMSYWQISQQSRQTLKMHRAAPHPAHAAIIDLSITRLQFLARRLIANRDKLPAGDRLASRAAHLAKQLTQKKAV